MNTERKTLDSTLEQFETMMISAFLLARDRKGASFSEWFKGNKYPHMFDEILKEYASRETSLLQEELKEKDEKIKFWIDHWNKLERDFKAKEEELKQTKERIEELTKVLERIKEATDHDIHIINGLVKEFLTTQVTKTK